MLAARTFQEDPCRVELAGVREAETGLFELLDALGDPADRVAAFTEYMPLRFQFDRNAGPACGDRPAYYLSLLRRWSNDSNGRSGAVLKSWVASRFGLRATYHGGMLAEDRAAREAYDRARNWPGALGIGPQLDLVYTFCQYELARRWPGQRWMTLFRGTHDPEEYAIHPQSSSPAGGSQRHALVQLNNLSSFTSDPEVAWEFGSNVWEVAVPLAKIVFFSGLLPKSLLMGESEHLVLGGYYNVRTLLC